MNANEFSETAQTKTPSAEPSTWSMWQLIQRGAQLVLFTPVARPIPEQLRAPMAWLLTGIYALWVVFLSRWLIVGNAQFNLTGLLLHGIPWAMLALMLWWAFDTDDRAAQTGRVGLAFCLQLSSSLVLTAFAYAWSIASVHAEMHKLLGKFWTSVSWTVYCLLIAWGVLVTLRTYHLLGMRIRRAVLVVVASTGLSVAMNAYLYPSIWYPAESENSAEQKPRLRLTQAQFETQGQLLNQQLQALQPQREGKHDVYAVLYAPYAPEDVFLKEVRMVERVLVERFAANGRVISLVNNAQTTATHAWATQENLQRSIQAAAKLMNSQEDILMIYLTSHGARDFKLASTHWPLETTPLTAQDLAQMLQSAQIKHRVIAVSACYSGGWIAPLQTDDSLILTAADATHTSFGCGMRSDLTFFGRAMFSEALMQTHSFEQAFAQAVPIIKKREEEAGKDDGFSNPQIFIGAQMKSLLRSLEKQQSQP